jgi:hypothetical protein
MAGCGTYLREMVGEASEIARNVRDRLYTSRAFLRVRQGENGDRCRGARRTSRRCGFSRISRRSAVIMMIVPALMLAGVIVSIVTVPIVAFSVIFQKGSRHSWSTGRGRMTSTLQEN